MAGLGIMFIAMLGILIFLVLFVIGIYNSLVRLRNQVDNAWSQIDVQLKRRHDLIPNLVETAKGYMTHERQTFERLPRPAASDGRAQCRRIVEGRRPTD
jgi:LemA protein